MADFWKTVLPHRETIVLSGEKKKKKKKNEKFWNSKFGFGGNWVWHKCPWSYVMFKLPVRTFWMQGQGKEMNNDGGGGLGYGILITFLDSIFWSSVYLCNGIIPWHPIWMTSTTFQVGPTTPTSSNYLQISNFTKKKYTNFQNFFCYFWYLCFRDNFWNKWSETLHMIDRS